ncbi:hypothetical protein GP5015_1206 [gamma proteobacterium HTCC5015]|nr:hypothetical protein GP5015_1206 [gamma proteobacterium HTCC5015]
MARTDDLVVIPNLVWKLHSYPLVIPNWIWNLHNGASLV